MIQRDGKQHPFKVFLLFYRFSFKQGYFSRLVLLQVSKHFCYFCMHFSLSHSHLDTLLCNENEGIHKLNANVIHIHLLVSE